MLKKCPTSYLACSSQIWLNLHVDHHRFGYITKLTQKKKTLGSGSLWALASEVGF
jgi:hypothetical protein